MQDETLKYMIALQEKFREKKGECGWLIGDMYWVPSYKNTYIYTDTDNDFAWSDSAIWLPKTIDDSSEEARKRSLWGMVKWDHDVYIHTDGEMAIEGISDGCSSPTLAILKALAAQWRIEV